MIDINYVNRGKIVKKSIWIRLIIAVLAQVILAIGIALLIKAGIGLGPVDAFNASLSQLTDITVGTMSILFNTFFIIGQIFVWRKNFTPIQYLQIPETVILGGMIDFFLIYVLTFEISSYLISVIIFGLGLIIMSFSVGAINTSQVIYSPLEGFCLALESVTSFKFVQYRWGADILFIICSFLFVSMGADNVLREGTIAVMLLFSPILNYFMERQIAWFNKAGLI